LLQKLTHGVEHGHSHNHELTTTQFGSIFLGLGVHAFLEGIPLGFTYYQPQTLHGLNMGILFHKIPEVILLAHLSFLTFAKQKTKGLIFVILFALITPLACVLSSYMGQHYYFVSQKILIYLVPFVAGSFIHISTTVLFESGTQHHHLTARKIASILIGFVAALGSLFL
jgi:hypothetical protein